MTGPTPYYLDRLIADQKAEIAALRSRAELAERELETANRPHADLSARLAESGRALKAIADWPAHVTHEEWERLRKIAHDAVYGPDRSVDEQSTPPKEG